MCRLRNGGHDVSASMSLKQTQEAKGEVCVQVQYNREYMEPKI